MDTFRVIKPRIVLHLGPHKTATTFMQGILEKNINILYKRNVKFIPLSRLRKDITNSLAEGKFEDGHYSNILNSYIDNDVDVLVLFDENLIGTLSRPIEGCLYPLIEQRLARLLPFLCRYDFSIHMIARPMDAYLISRYSEYLRHRKFVTFSHYYKTVDFKSVSWLDTYTRVFNALKKTVNVALFSEVVNNPESYLAAITGSHISFDTSLTKDPATVRSKITKDDYFILQEVAKRYSSNVTQEVIKVLEKYGAKESLPFSPLSDDQLIALRENYEKDLKELERLQFIKLLRLPDV